MPTNTKKKYQKKKPIDHCLLRPDMYVGSTRLRELNEYVATKQDNGNYSIVWKSIRSSPAILRIFIEALSNAVDNVERSRKTETPCTKIKVTIDPETGETSIWNDGDVVPVEIHEEEGCYNHTMIFGQMLTGSSYNDEEERMIAGRNGLGIKLCLKKGTLIPKFNGEIVKIEYLEVGDCVIGDDGLRRNITNTCEGNGKLFEVSQPRGNSYIVNENHILSLRMPDHKVIFWNTDKNGWSILWLDKENNKVCSKYISVSPPKIVCPECEQELSGNLGRHYKRMHKEKEVPKKTRRSPTVIPPEKQGVKQALQEMKEFAETIPDDNTIDIDIKDYMKLNKTTQGRLTGFVGECVDWEEQEVKLDPYVLGLWLGDGYKNGYRFAINSKDDPEILEYLEEWGKENDATFKNNPREPVAYYISSTKKSGVAPLKKLLSEYNLVDNKHIPQEYLVNSREVRLAVLAGMIDSDGTVQSDGRRITIAQGMDHSKLAGDVIFLAKSLGLMCSSHIKKTQWKYKGELRRGNAININISGDIEDIPTRVARKKCYNPLSRNVTNTGKISIQEVESGDYVGIEVDGNKRFVLEDFTVTHNCNIFSTQFQVKGYDPSSNKLFTQTWTNNMKTPGKPKITTSRLVRGYTQVTWTPDFARFGLKKYTKDIIQLYTRHVLDAAMLSNVSVYLNGKLIPIKSLSQYSGLYKSPTEEKLLIKNKDSTILVTPSTEAQVVSFVNGIYTRLGGQHVDAWSEAIFRPIVDKFNGKGKGKKSKSKSPKINIGDVRQFFRLFIVANVVRPEFDGQEKNKLESPGITAVVKKSHINSICKWSVMDRIEDVIRAKEMVVLRKAERKKKNVKIDGLDPANNAGGKYGRQCSLFICEGLSAKTYVVAGIETGVYGKTGRDWFGVLPVTGKVLNVRNSTPTSIAANKVIVSLIQTLGLSHGLDYRLEKNFKTLRYGRVIVVADADVDGIHIEGLIMNLIHTLFPTLLERDDPYIVSMKTPIARVFRGRAKDLLFYDERRFNKYLANSTKKVNAKYYKGLGTTREEDVPDTFGLKMVEFSNDEHATSNMNKVFHKKYADARKQWLGEYAPDRYAFSLDDQGDRCTMSISNFLNGEMIKFSHADCARSIPSGIDGLKESQRKILYAVRKRKLNFGGKSLKVAQLSGYTAEHSNYHHGEQNLQDTIVGMASGFPGTNNIPLLYPDGGFGTRLEGGKDAASARYIFTKKEALTDYIFRSEDDPLLTPVNDDGDLVQPEHYMPIIPMILVNGCTAGIGTGWSCTIPCFNPLDIIASIRVWLDNDGEVMLKEPETGEICCLLPELVPWYRAFKGEITASGDSRFKTEGILTRGSKRNTAEITELPIGMWTNKFKESCEDLVMKKNLKSIKNYSSTQDVHFILTESPDGIKCNKDNMKLHTYLYTSNMVLFNEKDQLKKFETPQEIIDNFCVVRLEYYIKRKKHQIKALEQRLRVLGNKERFITEVIKKTIPVMEQDEHDTIAQLEKRKYDKDPQDETYNYLLRLPIRTFTIDKVKELKRDISGIEKDISTLQKTKVEKIWLRELKELEKEYGKWLKVMEKRVPKKAKKSRKK